MRKVLIIFFLLFTVSIPIGLLTGIGSSIKLTEQRNLATMPEVSLAKGLDKNLYIELEKYFNDHFAFRGALVKSKNWIDYYLFKTSPSKKVYIGKDGWLFHTLNMKKYLADGCEYKNRIRNLARGLQNVERMLAESGQIFIFIIAPNKTTIYPEFTGLTRPTQGCSKSRYELLLESFEEFPVKGFIRLDDLFMKAKENGEQLYDRTDTHWNLRGEQIVIEEILRYLAPKSWKKYLPEYKVVETMRSGNMAQLMSLNIMEKTITTKDISYIGKTEKKDLKPLKEDDHQRVRFKYFSTPLPGKTLLPSAVIYRDSYMDRPITMLKSSFESLHAIWTYNLTAEEGLDDLNNSKIIIEELVERELHFIL